MSSIEPKPFAYVSIPPQSPRRTKYVSHHTITYGSLTGRLTLELEVTSDYLFTGSGAYDFDDNLVYHSFTRSGGQIVIQGTSIKGAVRNVLETISNSCISQSKKDEDGYIPHEHKGCSSIEKLCPACRLFGRTTRDESYAGRVSFSDALPIQLKGPSIVKIFELFSPSIRSSRRKFYQDRRASTISDKRPEKNTRLVEALERGSKLKFYIDFHNLAREELSLLLYSLGVGQDYSIKIGGAKPRGFGSVTFKPVKMNLYIPPFGDYKQIEGVALDSYLSDIMNQRMLLNEDLFKQYISETKKGRSDTAPRGVY